MRRLGPILIIVIGILALVADFFPNLQLPALSGGDLRTVETKLGLDLQGGLQIEYQAVPVGGKSPTQDDLNVIKTIVENRVNSQGVSEPVVQTKGTDRVVVELPGVSDPQAIRDLIGQTGDLEFIPLPKDKYGTYSAAGTYTATPGEPLPTTETPLFSGVEITGANPATDSNNKRAVSFNLTDKGSKLFGDYTTAHVGEFFAIVLDGTVVSAPYINQAITGGSGLITGGSLTGFAVAEQQNLITVLRYGSLPFPIQEVSVNNVSATLGQGFLEQSLFAGALGIALVILFMLIWYRMLGAVASFALIYYTLVVLAIFRLIPVTLTLAGIAGFILSIGMAVDANILIFERTKEELRSGKALVPALEAGFARAWNSIIDSNISTLITAGILYWFGSSTIRGFALVLIIGVLISMFSAITVTRSILRLLVKGKWARKAWLFGVTDEEMSAGAVVRPDRRFGERA